MNLSKKANTIIQKLILEYPDAGPELIYANSFELLIAVILSAQCTDVRVNQVTKVLFASHPTPESILELGEAGLIEIIRSCGFYKNKSSNIIGTCKRILEQFDGMVPDTKESLLSLPGVGNKTANVVLSNAFGVPAIAVDTHVFRVSRRIGLANGNSPNEVELELNKCIPKERWSISHHLLIFHGRRVCKARKPLCEKCVLQSDCIFFMEK